jgi:replicative DNA helicase
MAEIRTPPQFADGERMIFGGLLIDNEPLAEALSRLAVEDFYVERHRLIFEAMRHLFDRGEPVDWGTLTAELNKQGRLEPAGGTEYLTGLADAVPSAANIMHYVEVVREKGLRRQAIRAAHSIAEAAYQEDRDIREFLDRAEATIFGLGSALIETQWLDMPSLSKAAMARVESLYDRKEAITGVPSGFHDLDQLTAGWQPADLVIIAGRPSMGKTALALNIAHYAAIAAATPVGVFSLEMAADQIMLRLLCSAARVNLLNLRRGYLHESDWSRLITAVGPISEAPIWIHDQASLRPLEVRTLARRLKKEHNIGLIIIDYLQLMESEKGRDSREREISEISRSLKALAKELRVPVIALSQLNRKVEERPDKRPKLADLRESGAVEQDADVVLFVYRDEVYNKSPDNPKRGEAEIIIGKQRNGPIGTVKLQFNATWSRFLPLSTRDDAEM